MSDETTRVQIAAAEAGVQLFIAEDRTLKGRPADKLTPELRARISAVKGHLLGELLVAESIAWEQKVYTTAERARLNACAAPDQRNAWRRHMEAALSAALRGDAQGAAEAMSAYRLTTLAVAMAAELPEHRFPDVTTEYPAKES